MPSHLNHPDELLERNRAWAARMVEEDADFFARLSAQQAPQFLWIGCSDSRVPANQVTDLAPGEVFVHRNVANVVSHGDLNCLSVMQFAVEVLKVRHIIVCGHYGCGGVHAVLTGARVGLVDNWLRHVGDVAQQHATLLAACPEGERLAALCELNVIEQRLNVCQSTVVQDAWSRGQPLSVHAWIYGLGDGRLRALGPGVKGLDAVEPAHAEALLGVRQRHVPA
ncbi:MAG: carbonic anhydrase [Lysobacteraceae bacterium]|nr:MAG: carbonic anhydrase [Xanthomonadaceae bacterium]